MAIRTLLLAIIFALSPISAWADFVDNVLKEKNVDQKEFRACSSRSGVTSQQLARLAKLERHGPAVALVVGQYFETGKLDKNAPEVLRMLVKRKDIGDQSIAYAALSPQAGELIKGMAASEAKGDHQIAARMIAATAVMRRTQAIAEKLKPVQMKAGKGKPLALSFAYGPQVKDILDNSRDELTLEHTLLAVGLGRMKAAQQSVAKHAGSRRPEVAMAAQYAMASIGAAVDKESILTNIARRPKSRKAQPALSYDPRQTPRAYAIMAAGEAGLTEAVEPLMALVADKDLHTAVFAARALGLIGGQGVGPRMLGQINDDTLWPVRIAVYNAAGQSPDKESVPLLQQRYVQETGRLRQDALYALLSIVAGKPKGMTYDAFLVWWTENGEAFEVDHAATRSWRSKHRVGEAEVPELAGFYESVIISDRPVFAVDASKSMKGAQIESLLQTLDDVASSFPDRVQFSIVDFGGHVRALAGTRLIPARHSGDAMKQFKYDMELTLGTRSYDAIERAMGIAGMDTVHFLSDGAPIGGHLDNWHRINYATRLRCFVAPVAVHAIYFPAGKAGGKAAANPGGRVGGMKTFAQDHAGRFHVITVQPQDKKKNQP